MLLGAFAPILQYAIAPDESGKTSSKIFWVLLVAGVGFAQEHSLQETT